MPIDVGDPLLNAALGICFIALVAIGLVAAVPWTALGARRFSAMLRWAALPMLALALVYEALMPARSDRVDLMLLLPVYLLVLVSSVLRWVSPRRRRRH